MNKQVTNQLINSTIWLAHSKLLTNQEFITTLKYLFLKIYSIARDKEALVSDCMDSFGTYVHQNLSFFEAVQDWELKSFVAFLNILYSSKTHPGDR
jgi:hypothetical protein